ncbi:FAD-dependent oxidoreductase [Catellatospora methionotrophica]|uniref:FAD-dependent oxidoreductase n=1 Tax=Catellatospora methionotrophica TaxID=121620 RepID=A0A8J3LHJ6_9ACTN|nr:FAD-dependent monooxygenase [Catellatospora methionotrophica]GIG18380.1 FAD-dependent oxidoreductase [Catellatospora methionotrophica]
MDADVVISGGGPTGLLLAAELRLAGARVVVLERRTEPDPVPRANGLVGQVVTVLYRRGLYRTLARHGSGPKALLQRWFTGAYGTRPRPVRGFSHAGFRLDLRRLRDANPVHVLAVPQRRMEEVFEQHALALGAEIRRGHTFTGLTQDGDGVTVEVDGPDGGYRLRAAYLVGCDGSHSAVRKAAGIGFPGETSREVVIRMAHVVLPRAALTSSGALRAADGTSYRPYHLHRTPHGAFSFASFIPGVHVLSTHEWDAPAEQAPMTVDEAQASLSRVVGADVPVEPPPADGRPWILRRLTDRNNRLADPYRMGRVFVAGDAAHVFAGFGGSHLNLGLQDAVNLAWKLSLVARGAAPDTLLDTYAAERVPQARRALDRTAEQAELMAPGDEVTARRERYAQRLREPGFLREVAEAVAGLDLPYPTGAGHPMLGRMAPDLRLTHESRRIRLAALQRTARPLLLDLTGDPALAEAAAPWRDRVDVIRATPRDPGTPPALLIRPDGYVAWAAPDPAGLPSALTTWFGPPRTP